ncbi:MAG TPA: outer membrane beta-barrel protein [Candidatus Angelobacter sp.]
MKISRYFAQGRNTSAVMFLAAMVFVALQGSSFAQVQRPAEKIAGDSSAGSTNTANANSAANPANANANAATANMNSNAELIKELQQMQARIQQLENQLKNQSDSSQSGANQLSGSPQSQPVSEKELFGVSSSTSTAVMNAVTQTQESAKTEKPGPTVPFAFADWTWLNGNARNKDAVWDSKFFTPEIRFDANYINSFNHPQDDTLGGSTETFRSNEVQIEQISFGGDLHWQDVRARILTMGGMFGVTTPRNDASAGRGQWDLRGAYKYFSEANAGYHFNVNHGLNFDAGIFVSYIGLFSYYNFDNWAYQPSYVSSNTPWFFNGIRIQWFPTDKLKIEPWIVNGWQSYGRLGSKPGLGGQVLWRPTGWLSVVSNNYGMGEDTLGNGNGQFGRSRIHTDDSVEVKYYDHPEKFLDKMAFSLTGDLGCEYGGKGTAIGAQGQTVILNTNCFHDTPTSRKQTFAGWMAYNRFWFKKDIYAVTIGGGAMDNPGRYLALLPPINGADAITGSPYFTQNPGDPFKAWDTSLTFDWMPRQYITFRSEYGYRHANVPYFSGRGGITPGDNTFTSVVPNPNAGSIIPGTLFIPGPALSATPGFICVAGSGFCPDLRNNEAELRFAVMVKF